MAWNNNLFQNLLVVFVLLTLAALIYCKLSNKTLLELFKEIKEMVSPVEDVQNI